VRSAERVLGAPWAWALLRMVAARFGAATPAVAMGPPAAVLAAHCRRLPSTGLAAARGGWPRGHCCRWRQAKLGLLLSCAVGSAVAVRAWGLPAGCFARAAPRAWPGLRATAPRSAPSCVRPCKGAADSSRESDSTDTGTEQGAETLPESYFRSETEAEELRRMREELMRQWHGSGGAGAAARHGLGDESPFWAEPEGELGTGGLPAVGSVLLAQPASYLASVGSEAEPPAAALRTGLLPAEPDAQRLSRANLPVVLLTKRGPEGSEGLLLNLNVWTGQLLGDLGYPNFMTRPLYFGGFTRDPENPLLMLHPYPKLPGSRQLTADGLALTTNYSAASSWVHDGPGSALRFKFFAARVCWGPGEEHELHPERGIWLPMRCSRDLILREPDSNFEEPLWVQIAERAGGKLAALARAHSLLAD